MSDFHSQSAGCLNPQYNPTHSCMMSSTIGDSSCISSPVGLASNFIGDIFIAARSRWTHPTPFRFAPLR